MSAPVQLSADQLDKGQHLVEISRRIRCLSQTASATVIEIGRGLLRAKELVDHGRFGPWVTSECGFTLRSAQNYMRAALFADGKCETVSLLPLGAIYLLSSKSTPTAVRLIVLKWLEEGRVASEIDVELLLAQHRPIELDQAADRLNVTDECIALAFALLRRAGPELAQQLTTAPWKLVKVELLRLLDVSSAPSYATKQRPTIDGVGGDQLAVGIDLVRDAGDSNLFRPERCDTCEVQQAPIRWIAGDSVLTAPLEPDAATGVVETGDDQAALEQKVASADVAADSSQSRPSEASPAIDFLADTAGPLQGIPDFLRRT